MTTTFECQQELLQYAFDFFDTADAALRDETEAVRSAEARETTVVREGRRLPSDATCDGTRYEFQATTPVRAQVGERVRCLVDGIPPLRAVVADRGAGSLTLDVEADLGPLIASAAVLQDAAWLEEALRRRLADLATRLRRGDDTGPFSVDHAFRAHQPARTVPADGFVALPLEDALAERMACTLNEEQLHAVRTVLERPCTFVFGPPGTGKTRAVSACIAALLEQRQKVLVITPSNTAADVLLAQLHPWLTEHPLVARGLVQRVGANLTAHLTPELRALYVPVKIRARLRDELDEVEAWFAEESAAALALGCDTAVWNAELTSLAVKREAIAQEVGRNCHVTVTPVANVWLRPDLWRAYDAVVMDEASMLAVPALTLAAGLARARVVVAGDPQQLGPVAVANTPAARTLLRRDVFRMAGVDTAFSADDAPPYLVTLRHQYRMPRAVAALVSELWYDGGLRTAHARGGRSPLPGVAGPLLLVDTARLEPAISRGSRANAAHASVVAALVHAVKIHAVGRGRDEPAIGVFALYRDQVTCLLRVQQGAGGYRAELTATVHRAQGSEVAVALLDLCDAPGAAPTFLRAARGGDEGARLLNVALSRAREAAIVVANVPYLEGAGGVVVRRLLARLREEGTVFDAAELLKELDPGATQHRDAAGYAVAHER